MTAVTVDGTLVSEVSEAMALVRVDSANFAELEPGTSIELKLDSEDHRYVATVLALGEDEHITVLLDRVAITEQVALLEDVDQSLGGLPGDVPPIRGMVR